MGGYGSGRRSYRQKIEHCRTLDIYKMKREGTLSLGRLGNWVWSRDGQEVARIGYQSKQDTLVLDYKVRVGGNDWEAVTQNIPLETVGCHYGGQRVYARCPGVVNGTPCGRRVGKLFSGGKFFLCRHCYDLTYFCKSQPRHSRLLSRANKLRMALGAEPGTAYFIAPKPKGMWQRTYQRKLNEIEWCEYQSELGFLATMGNRLTEEERKILFG